MKIIFRFSFTFVLLLNLTFTYCSNIKVCNSDGPTWIWYPGDFEIYQHNIISIQRTQRGVHIPQIIRMDNFYPSVQFLKEVDLKSNDTIIIASEGVYNVQIDNQWIYNTNSNIIIPYGKHKIVISVCNNNSLPALFVTGKMVISDNTWNVSCYDKHWYRVGYWNFDNIDTSPNNFKLPTIELHAIKMDRKYNSLFVDFGKETFGYLKFKKHSGRGKLQVNYGESIEESRSDSCETIDRFVFAEDKSELFINYESRAFRYVNIKFDRSISIDSVSMLYEYLPVEKKGEFKSSNEKLNKIWNVAAYTLELNTREFFLDGIKRDRWVWSGDATQSYLMNYYLYFDKEINKRTMLALRGKDPIATHINTILDYSFYWFIGIYDYYLYTGDIDFIKQIYPKMISLMDFCLQRRNSYGFTEGLEDDWVFVDWANINRTGALCVEQMLLCRSLQTMSLISELLNDNNNGLKYKNLEDDLRNKINNVFWDSNKNIFMHTYKNNIVSDEITRYSNIFAVLFNFCSADQQGLICKNVLLNDSVLKITTPYMKFYELAALSECGQFNNVLKEIEDYWGGMLNLGATTFWESYNPQENGLQHYTNGDPDRPFGKSLCHAWGASPVYLIGKYFLGVRPTSAGFKEFDIAPHLGNLNFIEGKVPINNGLVEIYLNRNQMRIFSNKDGGILKFKSKTYPKTNEGIVKKISESDYCLKIANNISYSISYNSVE